MSNIDPRLSVAALAERYGYPERTIRRWLSKGWLGGHAIRLPGNGWSVPLSACEEYDASHVVEKDEPPVTKRVMKRRPVRTKKYRHFNWAD